MPLSPQKRQEVLAILKPIVDEAIKNMVGTMVRQEIEKHTDDGTGTSYAERVLLGRAPARNAKQLPYAGKVFARFALIQMASGGDRATAIEMARDLDIEGEFKGALNAGTAEGGGLLIADDTANDLITLLRPFSVVRRIGAMEVPIPRGAMKTPRIDVGATSGYVAEGAAIPASSVKTGAVNLVARKLATLVVMSNELATFSADRGAFSADAVILNDMLASMGQTEDVAFLLGTGTVAEPMGIVNWAAAANKFNATQAGADATLAEVSADLSAAEVLLRGADVPMQRPVWIMSPRSRLYLRDIRDSLGRAVYSEEMRQSGTVNAIPYFETNNIPNNKGAGSNESLVILVDAAQVMIGDVQMLAVDRSNAATVKIDGVNVNLFETDRSAIRVRQWNDLALRHKVGAAVIQAVKWGA